MQSWSCTVKAPTRQEREGVSFSGRNSLLSSAPPTYLFQVPCLNPARLRAPASAATAMRWLPGHRTGSGENSTKESGSPTENR